MAAGFAGWPGAVSARLVSLDAMLTVCAWLVAAKASRAVAARSKVDRFMVPGEAGGSGKACLKLPQAADPRSGVKPFPVTGWLPSKAMQLLKSMA
jgi:hypothetical protein